MQRDTLHDDDDGNPTKVSFDLLILSRVLVKSVDFFGSIQWSATCSADRLKEKFTMCPGTNDWFWASNKKSFPDTRNSLIVEAQMKMTGTSSAVSSAKKTWNSRMHGTQNFAKTVRKKSELKKLMSCEYGLLIDCLDRGVFSFDISYVQRCCSDIVMKEFGWNCGTSMHAAAFGINYNLMDSPICKLLLKQMCSMKNSRYWAVHKWSLKFRIIFWCCKLHGWSAQVHLWMCQILWDFRGAKLPILSYIFRRLRTQCWSQQFCTV